MISTAQNKSTEGEVKLLHVVQSFASFTNNVAQIHYKDIFWLHITHTLDVEETGGYVS